MAEKEYSELKKRALLAKQRLKMGYWQRMEEEKEKKKEEGRGYRARMSERPWCFGRTCRKQRDTGGSRAKGVTSDEVTSKYRETGEIPW